MVIDQDKMLTIREAAQEAGRTAETVRRWVWAGKLPAQKLGNQLFVKKSDLDRMLSKMKAEEKADRLAALEELARLGEEIAQRTGGHFDILEMLEESRASH